jgi:hypothetical protein
MRISASAVLAVAFLGMFVGSAHAQETIVAKVPFTFVVGGHELPAGRYDITRDSRFAAWTTAGARSRS